jgi:hypothetical protein
VSLSPTVETAVVYRGGGRRWLTLRAACRAIARQRIYSRYRASGDDLNEVDPDDLATDISRRARLYERRFRRRAAAIRSQEAAALGIPPDRLVRSLKAQRAPVPENV